MASLRPILARRLKSSSMDDCKSSALPMHFWTSPPEEPENLTASESPTLFVHAFDLIAQQPAATEFFEQFEDQLRSRFTTYDRPHTCPRPSPMSSHLHPPAVSVTISLRLLLFRLFQTRAVNSIEIFGHSAGSYTGAWVAWNMRCISKMNPLHLVP